MNIARLQKQQTNIGPAIWRNFNIWSSSPKSATYANIRKQSRFRQKGHLCYSFLRRRLGTKLVGVRKCP